MEVGSTSSPQAADMASPRRKRLVKPTGVTTVRANVEPLLRIVAEVSKELSRPRGFPTSMRTVLRRLGRLARLRRVVLLSEEANPGAPAQREHRVAHEWCARDVRTHAECDASTIASATFGELLPALRSGEFCWRGIADAARPLRLLLKRLEVRAISFTPFSVDDHYAGCLAFEDGGSRRRWESAEITALAAVTNVIGAAVQRQRLTERLNAERERTASLMWAGEALLGGAERLATGQHADSFIGTILAAAVKTVGARAGSILLRVPGTATTFRPLTLWEGGVLSPEKLAADPFHSRVEAMSSADPGGAFSRLVRGETTVMRVEAMRRLCRVAYEYHVARGHRVVWCVPLVRLGRVPGFFCLAFTDDRPFGQSERETVSILTWQLVLALEMTRLGEQTREAAVIQEHGQAAQERASAVLQERNRLAGEIHDTLAQGFASVLLHVEGAHEALRQAPSQLPACLEKIKILARTNLAEARRFMQTLRAPDPGETGLEDLPGALRRLSDSVCAEMTASVEVPRCTFRSVGRRQRLSSATNHELVRIAQEALRNAARHARANRITVALKYLADRVELRVADDGCGLPERAVADGYVPGGGAGLRFMRERAARLGGELILSNGPRRGTLVVARVPVGASAD